MSDCLFKPRAADGSIRPLHINDLITPWAPVPTIYWHEPIDFSNPLMASFARSCMKLNGRNSRTRPVIASSSNPILNELLRGSVPDVYDEPVFIRSVNPFALFGGPDYLAQSSNASNNSDDEAVDDDDHDENNNDDNDIFPKDPMSLLPAGLLDDHEEQVIENEQQHQQQQQQQQQQQPPPPPPPQGLDGTAMEGVYVSDEAIAEWAVAYWTWWHATFRSNSLSPEAPVFIPQGDIRRLSVDATEFVPSSEGHNLSPNFEDWVRRMINKE